MFDAELNHNPYLLRTSVRFNGQAPRINSLVEKYENAALKDWVASIPQIFHDEMNGYDFDLYFTGTVSDFADLQTAFAAAKVSSDMVRLLHKNVLADAEAKSQAIDQLLQWFMDHPNRKLDYGVFYGSHRELFVGTYTYVIIRGYSTQAIHPQVAVELIDRADELKNTVLTNIPILFCIDEKSVKQFRDDLAYIMNRSDVKQNQLFFMVHPQLKTEQVKRVIMDLGVENPQLVTSFGDASVLAYLRDYPFVEYIRDAISVFEESLQSISAVLADENAYSQVQNAEIRAVIDGIDGQLERLRHAALYFAERKHFDVGHSFTDLLHSLSNRIGQWRNRKTKVVGDSDCDDAAVEYNMDIAKHVDAFNVALRDTYMGVAASICEDFTAHYQEQGMDLHFYPAEIALAVAPMVAPFTLVDAFIAMKVVTLEDKTDFRTFFRLNGAREEKEPVCVVTCYYAQWREKALEIVLPIAQNAIAQCLEQLVEYYHQLADGFHTHLADLIAAQEGEKAVVAVQLSDDERKLQEDNDWFAGFREQLLQIERD